MLLSELDVLGFVIPDRVEVVVESWDARPRCASCQCLLKPRVEQELIATPDMKPRFLPQSMAAWTRWLDAAHEAIARMPRAGGRVLMVCSKQGCGYAIRQEQTNEEQKK